MPVGPLLPHDVTPEDISRGYLFGSTFRSAHDEIAKGGTIYGAPLINHGVALNGTTDYIVYAMNSQLASQDPICIDAIFSPGFATNENAERRLFSSTGGNYALYKRDNAGSNELRLVLGGTLIVDIAEATYSPLWAVDGWNVISISGTSGATDVRMNNSQIVTADATAWTPTDDATFAIGATGGGASFFDGVIYLIKMYGNLSVASEHTALWRSRGMFE
jgi:hypothetical protein